MNTPKQQGSLLAWACLLLSSKERRRQTSKSIQGMEGTTPKSMCVNPAKLKLKQRLVKKWLEEQLAGISPCLAASCSVGPAEVVRSDKKLLGHRGNDMAIRRFTSPAHRQSGFHKKNFAKENVANAAKAATDFSFFPVLAQQKKRGKKRWGGFVFPPSSASVTCIGATRAWC